jgi:hypothetical protein
MSSSTGSLKSMGYDHPSYTTRQLLFQSIMTAGSGGVSGKFLAHANMILFSLNAYTTIAGTSTYTFTAGGTGTVAVAATQLSLIRITNTASAGATIALSTSTYGPYTVGGSFVGGGTQTNQVGAYSQFQLNTNTGTAGLGGVPINQGDQVFIVNGTDLTAVELVAVDYQLAPIIGGVMA